MSILSKTEILDATKAMPNFSSRDDFFIALMRVSAGADSYLRDYTAPVILYDDKTRKDFLKELDIVRSELIALCVKDAPVMLGNILEAIDHMDTNSLIDGLRFFYADMKILKNSIQSALI
jgi:hypothetical protein